MPASDRPAAPRAGTPRLRGAHVVRAAPAARRVFKLAAPLAGAMALALSAGSTAQDEPGDPAAALPVQTPTLPDARPGECYAKVVTPPAFATRSEEIVVQEASERIEAVPATFRTEEERIVVKEASTVLEAVPATFETTEERVRTRPRELVWEVDERGTRPASQHSLAALGESGIDIDAVEPGSCFAEHYSEPTYRTELQRVLVKEGSTRFETVPAVYETVEERVVVREATTEIVNVPAVFRTESERVLVEPARSVWRPGRGPVERIDDTTGEIMCLVELPARYESVTRTVLDTPSRTETVPVPAEYETVQVQRLVTPASRRRIGVEPEYTTVETVRRVADASFAWAPDAERGPPGSEPTGQRLCLNERPAEFRTVQREIVAADASIETTEVPAEYRTLAVQRLDEPASVRRERVPERVENVTTRVEIRPSSLVWRPVLCETNMTPEIVADLQRALAREGFDPGVPDGIVGRGTMEAIEAFQHERELDRGGITYQTLQALNVDS